MNFVKFTEHNDHEGEDWHFWLQLDGNETQLGALALNLNTFDDDGESFELDLTPVPESDVDVLVKHGGQGYMNYQNKVTGTFTCPKIEEYSDIFDNFYKGDITRSFK